MDDNKLNVQGGVLIIGSLLWQPNLGKDNNTDRKDWREKHLDESSGIAVHAPIRYGRMSSDDIYTMTFSNSCRKKPGIAYLLPFRQNPILTFDELLKEAKELSRAEGMQERFIKSKDNLPWAVLAILFNDSKIDSLIKKSMLNWWEKQLKADKDYNLFKHKNFRLGTEQPCIRPYGHLNFPWIKVVDQKNNERLNQVDFLLAIATVPTDKKYPSIKKMSENVRKDKIRKYFINNTESGITTFQDERILKKLKKNK